MTTEVNRIDRTADEGAGEVEGEADIRMTGEGVTAVVGRIAGAEIEIGTGIETGTETETETEIGDL
jgi:hypothetical protein